MKYALLSALAASAVVQAGLIPPKNTNVDWRYEKKRQVLGMATSLLGMGGKVAGVPGAAPTKQTMTARSPVAGSKTIKMRYGPYSVISMNKRGLTGEAGMLWNYPDTDIPKPCTDCTIVGIVAGLEYPDGKNANIDTGMWLHHMVHFTIGTGRVDATCAGNPMSLPHFDVGATASNSERFFSSGNERTEGYLTVPDDLNNKVGYHLRSNDKFAFIVDLMNMNMEDKTVYMTMTYDFIDGHPSGYSDIRPVWFDVDQCGVSEVAAKAQTGTYQLTSRAWKPDFTGKILGAAGHLHDGGTALEIYVNNQKVCTSEAGYAERPEYILSSSYMSMGTDKMAKNHISSMKTCRPGKADGFTISDVNPTQSWTIAGKYDYNQHEGNIEGGRQASVMAISIMFVQVPPNSYPAGSGGTTTTAASSLGSLGSLSGLLSSLGLGKRWF